MIYETFHKLKDFADRNPQKFAALTQEEFESQSKKERNRCENPKDCCDCGHSNRPFLI